MSRVLLKKSAAALALLSLLSAVTAGRHGVSGPLIARFLLGAAALGGGVLFVVRRQRPQTSRFALPPRLSVASRAALSPKTAVALVEADGQRFLVIHGEGFAELTPIPPFGEVLP